jgi:hypothetical protein
MRKMVALAALLLCSPAYPPGPPPQLTLASLGDQGPGG